MKVSSSCSIAHFKLRTKFCWRGVFANIGVWFGFIGEESGLISNMCDSRSDFACWI